MRNNKIKRKSQRKKTQNVNETSVMIVTKPSKKQIKIILENKENVLESKARPRRSPEKQWKYRARVKVPVKLENEII
jgi:hypothetical protein